MRLYGKDIRITANDNGDTIAVIDLAKVSGKLSKFNVELTVADLKRAGVVGVVVDGLSTHDVALSVTTLLTLLATSGMKVEIKTPMTMDDLEYWIGLGIREKTGTSSIDRKTLIHIGRSITDALAVNGFQALCEVGTENEKLYIVEPNIEEDADGGQPNETEVQKPTTDETSNSKPVRTRKKRSDSN